MRTPPLLPAANLEWLCTEAGPELPERVAAAAGHGFGEVEVWQWRHRDLDALARALAEHRVALRTMVVDPAADLTAASSPEAFVRAVTGSAEVARRLGAPFLVVTAGDTVPGLGRDVQRSRVLEALRAAAAVLPDDVTLLLEPLNDRVDHVGTFLTSTSEGLDLVQEVGSPRVRLLLDVYHALMMGEDLGRELAGRAGLVAHAQVADVPGRTEPGSGDVDWSSTLEVLHRAGYRGGFGLECRASEGTAAVVRRAREIPWPERGTDGPRPVPASAPGPPRDGIETSGGLP
ncbi:TIM barrel protein [Kineococcus gynurae]|uniref:TIM barrel protein n=1 Tax=Kineococcus gynurae TaxID=452979 RepID=A0ABV5LPN2_9ACTN